MCPNAYAATCADGTGVDVTCLDGLAMVSGKCVWYAADPVAVPGPYGTVPTDLVYQCPTGVRASQTIK